jgi:hypothetical protein
MEWRQVGCHSSTVIPINFNIIHDQNLKPYNLQTNIVKVTIATSIFHEFVHKFQLKLENHTNALTVNLLDNTETTHRLKRYTVLTLRDTPK